LEKAVIVPNRPAGRHWAITVQELLDITAAKILSTRMQEGFIRNLGITLGLEWAETLSFVQAGGGPNAPGPGHRWADGNALLLPKILAEEEPEGGASTFLIRTGGRTASSDCVLVVLPDLTAAPDHCAPR
jgi:hypothetical protein